jgi:hypothetical protein
MRNLRALERGGWSRYNGTGKDETEDMVEGKIRQGKGRIGQRGTARFEVYIYVIVGWVGGRQGYGSFC